MLVSSITARICRKQLTAWRGLGALDRGKRAFFRFLAGDHPRTIFVCERLSVGPRRDALLWRPQHGQHGQSQEGDNDP
jgi:hypothetical protein